MMEEIAGISDSNDELPKERLAPLGATSPENESGYLLLNQTRSYSTKLIFLSWKKSIFNDTSRLQMLEQEQEQLNASLMALTTHFGQVQFRLKQIVAAPNDDKEVFILLKYLIKF